MMKGIVVFVIILACFFDGFAFRSPRFYNPYFLRSSYGFFLNDFEHSSKNVGISTMIFYSKKGIMGNQRFHYLGLDYNFIPEKISFDYLYSLTKVDFHYTGSRIIPKGFSNYDSEEEKFSNILLLAPLLGINTGINSFAVQAGVSMRVKNFIFLSGVIKKELIEKSNMLNQLEFKIQLDIKIINHEGIRYGAHY